MMNAYSIAAVLLFSFLSNPTFAGRKVNIPIDSSFKLTNTSAVSVTYNLTCKDKNAVTIPALTQSGQTLLAGKTNVIVAAGSSGGACAAGWTESAVGGGASPTMKRCNGTPVAFSSISSACSTSAHVCTLEDVANLKGASNNTYDGAAFVSTGTWSFHNGSSWTDYSGNTTHFGYTKFNSGGYGKFNNGSNGGGAVTFFDDGGPSTISPVGNVFCCSDYSDLAQCEVEITSDGHLSSPQFLGGKAF